MINLLKDKDNGLSVAVLPTTIADAAAARDGYLLRQFAASLVHPLSCRPSGGL
jgi:hypothetical protein